MASGYPPLGDIGSRRLKPWLYQSPSVQLWVVADTKLVELDLRLKHLPFIFET